MSKDLRETFKEWVPEVPGKWYKILLHVIVPMIPLIGGVIFAVIQSVRGLPVPIWNWVVIIASVLLFVIISFFAFHRMRLERDSEQSRELGRQERKEWRKSLSNLRGVPGILFKMYERAKTLCERNKKPLTEEYWGDIANSFFGAHQGPTIVPSLDKMASKEDIIDMINSTPDPFNSGNASTLGNLNRLILNLQATMSLHDMGAMPLTKGDVDYEVNEMAVQMLQQYLPNKINAKIKECILISNGLASLLCADFSNTETSIADELLIVMQYMLPCMDDWTQKMRDEISVMIEDFILGE